MAADAAEQHKIVLRSRSMWPQKAIMHWSQDGTGHDAVMHSLFLPDNKGRQAITTA